MAAITEVQILQMQQEDWSSSSRNSSNSTSSSSRMRTTQSSSWDTCKWEQGPQEGTGAGTGAEEETGPGAGGQVRLVAIDNCASIHPNLVLAMSIIRFLMPEPYHLSFWDGQNWHREKLHRIQILCWLWQPIKCCVNENSEINEDGMDEVPLTYLQWMSRVVAWRLRE